MVVVLDVEFLLVYKRQVRISLLLQVFFTLHQVLHSLFDQPTLVVYLLQALLYLLLVSRTGSLSINTGLDISVTINTLLPAYWTHNVLSTHWRLYYFFGIHLSTTTDCSTNLSILPSTYRPRHFF